MKRFVLVLRKEIYIRNLSVSVYFHDHNGKLQGVYISKMKYTLIIIALPSPKISNFESYTGSKPVMVVNNL